MKLTKGDTQSTQTVGGPSGCFQPALETNQRGACACAAPAPACAVPPAPRLRPPAPWPHMKPWSWTAPNLNCAEFELRRLPSEKINFLRIPLPIAKNNKSQWQQEAMRKGPAPQSCGVYPRARSNFPITYNHPTRHAGLITKPPQAASQWPCMSPLALALAPIR